MKANDLVASAIYLHALTPVHAGTGQVSASVVDLPVAREKATNWPVLPGSSLKGVLKSDCKDTLDEKEHTRLFGREAQPGVDGREDSVSGKLQFGDARLLCFPVRSWHGVFVYATCPLALRRLQRDFAALGVLAPFDAGVPELGDVEVALVGAGSVAVNRGKVRLEDLELSAAEDAAVDTIGSGIASAVFGSNLSDRTAFLQRFLVLHDTVFDFLADNALEITARIALNPTTKTVDKEKGALWYEEAVPAEAIFVAPVLGAPLPALPDVIQIGGNETIGRGLCRVMVASR
jgi:CRISPR-associated protein Cmr4